MGRAHVLYRFWAADDSLLYVGLTMDPGTRWTAHSHTKPWWTTVAKVTLEHFSDRASVTRAEAVAIQAEKPKYNISPGNQASIASACPRGCVGGWSISCSGGGIPCRQPCPPWRNRPTRRSKQETPR